MNENIFEIRDLKCSYENDSWQQENDEDVVLEVNHLDIKRSDITVFLGPSGSGKSTLLETLGLMNETIKEGHVSFYPEKDSKSPIKLHEIKEAKDHRKNDIRKDYYSFIFQSTNLMSNFTAIENIAVTSLIQRGKNFVVAWANSIKSIVNLNVRSCTWKKYPYELSGGERLRVSVARALTPKHSVLFGDEPTGNLDHFNSDQVLGFIREKVKEEDNLSVIIVSHSIELAMKFADQIIILTPDSKNIKKYNILPENIIQKEDKDKWNKQFIQDRIKPHNDGAITYNKLLEDLTDEKLKNEILKELDQECEPINKANKPPKAWFLAFFHFTCMKLNSLWKKNELTDFIKLFFNNEGKELLGRKYLNFIFVTVIVAITYFAIGFSNGSLNYLSKKMDDPFVRAVNVRLPGSSREYSRVLRDVDEWMQDSVLRFYNIEDHYGYNVFSYYVNGDQENSPNLELKIRTIKYDDPLVKTILDERINNSIGNVFQDSLKTSLIVTRDALDRTESSEIPAFLKYEAGRGGKVVSIPLEIQGIVDRLPGNEGVSIDVIVPHLFYEHYFGNSQLRDNRFLYSDKKLHVIAIIDSTRI
ncbi:MAG: ATP-binding cassette domain-containing protein [Prolixibacteraceae bacterium]|nr:ATP-binding cassette domain-containing protein [Prolixibacteraceae bacterium]